MTKALPPQYNNLQKPKTMYAQARRMVEKFVMIEFLSNRLNTQEEVDDMISLIGEKLDMFPWEARGFLRECIGRGKKPAMRVSRMQLM